MEETITFRAVALLPLLAASASNYVTDAHTHVVSWCKYWSSHIHTHIQTSTARSHNIHTKHTHTHWTYPLHILAENLFTASPLIVVVFVVVLRFSYRNWLCCSVSYIWLRLIIARLRSQCKTCRSNIAIRRFRRNTVANPLPHSFVPSPIRMTW